MLSWKTIIKTLHFLLNLSKEDEQILANAGNNQDLMFAPSAVITEYDVKQNFVQN